MEFWGGHFVKDLANTERILSGPLSTDGAKETEFGGGIKEKY